MSKLFKVGRLNLSFNTWKNRDYKQLGFYVSKQTPQLVEIFAGFYFYSGLFTLRLTKKVKLCRI